nr:MAG TPA: hypothetical protein [Caudoviricetes sp.]
MNISNLYLARLTSRYRFDILILVGRSAHQKGIAQYIDT